MTYGYEDCQGESPRRMVPRLQNAPNPKQAFGDTKVPLGWVPPAGVIYCALAMWEGGLKYGPYNWRTDPVEAMTYVHAALRHLEAWIDGEDNAPDSGFPHLGHVMACMAILADAIETDNLIDNRPPKGLAGRILERFQGAASKILARLRKPKQQEEQEFNHAA